MKESTITEALAAMLSEQGDRKVKAVTHAVSLRIPLPSLAFIDAFRKRTMSSRQKIAVYLIEAGIQEVLSRLDEDTRRQLEARHLEELNELVGNREDRQLWDSEEK